MTAEALAEALPDGPLLGFAAAGLAALSVLVLLGGRGDAAAGSAGDALTAVAPATPATGAEDAVSATHPPAGRGANDPSGGADVDGGERRPPVPGRGDDVRRATEAEVSSALALLALAYRSGLPTWDVLDAVAAGLTGRASTDLRQVAAALRWGATEAEAWASVGPTWAHAARAVAIAHQAGVPPGAMLLAASDDLHAAELERLEVSAAKVGVRLVAPLGLVLLPAFCLTTVAPLVIALAHDLLIT